jgi:Ubiquitin elongating factor core
MKHAAPCRVQLRRDTGALAFYMLCASKFIEMLVLTSAAIPAPLLSPEMAARVAEMLNYFLRHLVGPDRAKLRVSDPGKARRPAEPVPLRPCCHFCFCPRNYMVSFMSAIWGARH